MSMKTLIVVLYTELCVVLALCPVLALAADLSALTPDQCNITVGGWGLFQLDLRLQEHNPLCNDILPGLSPTISTASDDYSLSAARQPHPDAIRSDAGNARNPIDVWGIAAMSTTIRAVPRSSCRSEARWNGMPSETTRRTL